METKLCADPCSAPVRRPGLDEEEQEGRERRLEEERDKWLGRMEERSRCQIVVKYN